MMGTEPTAVGLRPVGDVGVPDIEPVFPRLASATLDAPDPQENARVLRHAIKGELNALAAWAYVFLLESECERRELDPTLRRFLEGIGPLTQAIADELNRIQELPPQPPRTPARRQLAAV